VEPGNQGHAASEPAEESDHKEIEQYLRSKLDVPSGKAVNFDLDHLRDTGKAPTTRYQDLVALAIFTSREKRLPLKEIYKILSDKYVYYRNDKGGAWKVRFASSLAQHDPFIVWAAAINPPSIVATSAVREDQTYAF
jgi:hypothetical protein